MKKIFVKFLVFVILFIPTTSVFADDWEYDYKRMPLNDIVDTSKITQNMTVKGNYKMEIKKINNTYYKTVHVAKKDGKIYHGYCLHVGKAIYKNAVLKLHKGFTDLPNSDGVIITDTQQKVLKNILASGYQNGEGGINKFVNGNYGELGTCSNKTICTKVLATQILVWEVMAGARTSYQEVPNINPETSPYNKLVSINSNLKNAYKKILDDANDLATDVKTPKVFGTTINLKWSDATGKYVSDKINIGEYNIKTSNSSTLTISSKDKDNNVVISSTTPITSAKEIKAELVKGQTTDGSTEFRWFRFEKNSNGQSIAKGQAQDIVMGDYSIVKKKSFNISTETGQFKISKIDSVTKEILKGSKFNLYKCSGSNCATKDFVREIDLTVNAQTVNIAISKSGEYLFEEIQTPKGYESIGQFRVEFSIEGKYANIKNIYSSLGNIQKIEENKLFYSLVIGNKPKQIAINKINGKDNSVVKGATFRILSNGQPLKFDKIEDVYRYSVSGTITDIQDVTTGTYNVALLPEGQYVLEEINTPYPFSLQNTEEERQTKFSIDSNSDLLIWNYTTNSYDRASNASIIVKNFTTEVQIIKSGENGELLGNVKFELYDSSKQKQIGLIKNETTGNYEYPSEQSTSLSQIITNAEGRAKILYLPAGTYYLKETNSGDNGTVINKDTEWTQIDVTVTRNSSDIVVKSLVNKKASFNFYKIDEDGNYLSTGKFKLQKYNTNKAKYEDAPLIYNEKDNTYTIDTTGKSSLYVFTPKKGIATFVSMNAKAKYRIVEIEAPEGFVLPKVSETHAEFVINENGYAIGNTTIINKKITVGEGAQASAELIINISTGQERIRYALIISSLAIIIIGLFILNKKIKK